MDRRELLTLISLPVAGTLGRSAPAEAAAAAESQGEPKAQALAAKVEQSYESGALHLHFLWRTWEWRERGQIAAMRDGVSLIWNQGSKTLLDPARARSFDERGALIQEHSLQASQLHLLAACLGKLTDFDRQFVLKCDDDQPRWLRRTDLLALRARPRSAPEGRTLLLLIDARSFRVRSAYFTEHGGARHRLDFERLERNDRALPRSTGAGASFDWR